MSQSGIDHYIAEFSNQKIKPDWLMDNCNHAISLFKSTGFPNTRQENWKYTSVREIAGKHFFNMTAIPDENNQEIINSARFTDLDFYELVFINGHLAQTGAGLPENIIAESIESAITQHPELLQQYLDKKPDSFHSGFAALNSAFFNNGAFIRIPDQLVLEKPLTIYYLSTSAEQPFMTHPFNLLILGKQAQATIIESYLGFTDAEYLTNTVTKVIMDDASILNHYKIQQESPGGYHIANTSTCQGRDSILTSHFISLGGRLVRNDINSDLNRPGASIFLNGLYMTTGKQHVDNHTLVNHLHPHTRSEENYRGVLDGYSRGVFNGKVVVHKNAQKTDAKQSNANLLLSDQAEIDTKPELEIYADDVKCSHGATVGQLDENMLFYLRSRAIDEETARSLLTYAFAEDVINKIEFLPLRKRLESSIIGKLPDATLIREFAA